MDRALLNLEVYNLSKRKLIGIIILLIAFIGVSAIVKVKLDQSQYLENGESCFTSLYTDLNGNLDGTTINCWTDKYDDDKENAGGHYIFLPSCANLADTHIFFSGADELVLMDSEASEVINLKDNGSLKKITIDKEYTADFYSQGQLVEEGRLTFMQAENLPTVFINTDDGTMDNVHVDKEYRETGNTIIYRADGTVEFADQYKYLKGHGNTSWQIEKKTYQIRFSKPASLFGMNISDKWVLQSNGMDHSLMRNSIVFGMANALGMRAVPETTYAELYFNGLYNGLYQIEAKASIEPNRLNLTDLDHENSQVNSAMLETVETTTVSADDGSKRTGLDIISPDDITGGYLVERDYGEKYGSSISKFTTSSGESYVIKSPEYASMDEVNYIADKFELIDELIRENDADISQVIDLESFADKFLIEEFSKNDAAGSTSSYFYKDIDKIDKLIYAGPPWDYDKTFGKNSNRLMSQTNTLNFLTSHAGRTVLFFNLYRNNSDFLNRVKENYIKRLSPYLDELVRDGGIIDDLTEIINNDHEMDEERWGYGRNENKEWIQQLKDYISERKEFTDRIWVDNEEMHILYFPRNNESHSCYIGICDGDTLEYMPYDYATKGNEDYWYDVDTGEIIDENTPITRDMTIMAKAKEE